MKALTVAAALFSLSLLLGCSSTAKRLDDKLVAEPEINRAQLSQKAAQSIDTAPYLSPDERAKLEALRRYNIRYTMVGGFSFYERAEVKDLLSYLRLVRNPHDSMALNRVINTSTCRSPAPASPGSPASSLRCRVPAY